MSGSPKILTLMPDYGCFALWISDEDGLRNIVPESLPIHLELQREITLWSKEFDATLDQVYPPDSCFPSKEMELKFVETGRRLAKELSVSLVDHYKVEYFNILNSIREQIDRAETL